jgi:hypothetical protein
MSRDDLEQERQRYLRLLEAVRQVAQRARERMARLSAQFPVDAPAGAEGPHETDCPGGGPPGELPGR